MTTTPDELDGEYEPSDVETAVDDTDDRDDPEVDGGGDFTDGEPHGE